MEVIESLGKIIHLLLHMWEEFGSVRFGLPRQYLMPCLGLIQFKGRKFQDIIGRDRRNH